MKKDKLAEIDAALQTRRLDVEVGGLAFSFECLDDLDQVIDQLVGAFPGGVQEVTPHFGVVWPGAIGLAEHLIQAYKGKLGGLDILEVGCGLALPSMVASRLGAAKLVATDRHPLTELFLGRNAATNGIAGLQYERLDWRDLEAEVTQRDVILGSDVLYEPAHAGYLAHLVARVLKKTGFGLFSDQGRRYFDDFIQLLLANGCTAEIVDRRKVMSGRSTSSIRILKVGPP